MATSTTPKPDRALAEVEKNLTNLTSPSNVLRELQIVEAPLAKCEEMLLPAPDIISLTAKLILISNKNSFKLRKPNDGFKHLRYESFRAAFAQVAHSIQDAFTLANKNMNEIRLRSSDMPKDYNTAAEILMTDSNKNDPSLLKLPLKHIQEATDKCLELAQATEQSFDNVTAMTRELYEATLDTQNQTEDEQKRTRKIIEGLIITERECEASRKSNQEKLNDLKKNVDDANERYKNSVDKADSMVIGMVLAQSVQEIVKSGLEAYAIRSSGNTPAAVAMNALPKAVDVGMKIYEQANGASSTGDENSFEMITDEEAKEAADKEAAKIAALTKAEFILGLAAKLKEYVADNGRISEEKVYSHDCEGYIPQFSEMKRNLGPYAKLSKNAQKAIDLCAKGWTICNKLNKYHAGSEATDVKGLIGEINDFYTECQQFSTHAHLRLHGESLKPPGPIQKVKAQIRTVLKTNAMVNHTHFQVEQAMAYLKHTQKQQEKAEEERRQLQAATTERLKMIQDLNTDDVNYSNIRECLGEGLQVMGQMRKHWAYLALYFQYMAALIKFAQSKTERFIDFANYRSENQAIQSDILRQCIYEEAFGAVKLAIVARQLSKTYCSISDRFLMPQVAALDEFFDARDERAIAGANQKLQQISYETQEGIRKIIEDGRVELKNNLTTRQAQLQSIINQLEPLMSTDDIVQNKESVQLSIATMSEVDEEENDASGAANPYIIDDDV